jgi:hypothetical protein
MNLTILLALALLGFGQTDQSLRKELLAMGDLDQKIQLDHQVNPPGDNFDAKKTFVFVQNANRLRQIIQTQGFPTAGQVGSDAMGAIFLIIQHADFAPEFQLKCLPTFQEMAKRQEIKKAAVAYLTDRVLVNAGKPQRYGTQLSYDSNATPHPKPVEKPDKLDKRRAEMGLPPEQEYLQSVIEFQKQMRDKAAQTDRKP